MASWALLVAGVASLAYAGLRGDLEVFLLVVVPVVAGTGAWASLGLLATIAGVAGLLWTSATPASAGGRAPGGPAPPGGFPDDRSDREHAGPQEREAERETKGGGVILLGPIPIAWGSDRRTLGWLVAAGIALTVAAIALTLVLRP